jgi:hypothetical protein
MRGLLRGPANAPNNRAPTRRYTGGRVASMAALPAPNKAICDWEAEVVLILMMPGGPAGIGLAGGQGPAVPVAGDTFRGGAC